LEPEENEEVIAAVFCEVEGVRKASIAARLNKMQADGVLTELGSEQLRSAITHEGHLRLLPGACGTDGFFIAMIGKDR
jgi:16S rRNA C967 or C1407 C5-methylase (RsmB/RsmF family)